MTGATPAKPIGPAKPNSPTTSTGPARAASSRRGEARRQALLDAAAELLVESGYAALSTRQVAARAQASKETLYAHFRDKRGLLEALVAREAEAINAALRTGLEEPAARPLRTVLEEAVGHLIALLTGPRSVAINRAAIAALPADPELAEILSTKGRGRTGPLFQELLAEAGRRGELAIDSPQEAFEELVGLALRDSQVRALLGKGPAWTDGAIGHRAQRAVTALYMLYAPDRAGDVRSVQGRAGASGAV